MKIMRFIILLSAFAGSMMAVKSMEKDYSDPMDLSGNVDDFEYKEFFTTVQRMILHGEDLNALTMHPPGYIFEFTPLMVAAFKGYDVIIKLLLEHGAQMEIEAGWGTALAIAVLETNENCANLLLEYGANPNCGVVQSSLAHALDKGNLNLCEVLLKHNADPNFIWFFGKNKTVLRKIVEDYAYFDNEFVKKAVYLILGYGAKKSFTVGDETIDIVACARQKGNNVLADIIENYNPEIPSLKQLCLNCISKNEEQFALESLGSVDLPDELNSALNIECVICNERLDDCVELSCGHNRFHVHCLEQWKELNATCPMCRTDLNTNN